MVDGYRIKHIFNYMLKGSRPHEGKVNLARLAIMEDINRELHVVLLFEKNKSEPNPNPSSYLNSYLPGMATSG